MRPGARASTGSWTRPRYRGCWIPTAQEVREFGLRLLWKNQQTQRHIMDSCYSAFKALLTILLRNTLPELDSLVDIQSHTPGRDRNRFSVIQNESPFRNYTCGVVSNGLRHNEAIFSVNVEPKISCLSTQDRVVFRDVS